MKGFIPLPLIALTAGVFALLGVSTYLAHTSDVTVGATPVFTVTQGGTGWGNIEADTLLTGNGTGRLATTSIGSGLSLAAGVLSATASGGGSGNVATSSAETSGFLSYWTSTGATPATLGKVATGTVSSSGGITTTASRSVIGGALSIACDVASNLIPGCLAAADWTTFNAKESALTFSWPLIRTTNAISWGGLSTSSAPTQGQLPYWTGVNTFGSVATGTVSSSGGITTTASRSVLGGALSIACDVASASIPGCLAAADFSTFNGKQATIGVTWPITLSGATIGFNGLSTTSALAAGANILYATGVNTVASVATGTASCTTGASCTSFTVIGSSPSITTTLGTSVDLTGEVTGDLPFSSFVQGAANTVVVNQSSATADFAALATSTFANTLYSGTAGQVLYRTSSGTWTGTASTTFSTGLTYAAGGVTCDTSSGTVFGCLTAANFVAFNANRLATSAVLTQGQVLVAGSGGNTAYSIATGTVAGSGLVAVTAGQAVIGSGLTVSLSNINANTVVGNLTASAAAPTSFSTTSLFAAGTAGNVLGYTNGTWAPVATATCLQITGSSGLCDGDDATGAGASFPFLSTTNYGATANSTSTPIWFTAGLQASTTNNYFTGLTVDNSSNTDSFVTLGPTNHEWSLIAASSSAATAYLFSIASSTNGSFPAFTIDKNLLSTIVGGYVSQASSTVVGNFTTTGTTKLATALSGLALTTSGTVSAITTGTIGVTGVVGLSAGVPAYVATSSLYGVGTGGQVLGWSNGALTGLATTTFSSGLTYAAGNVTNTGVTSNVAGAGISVSGATGAVTITNTIGYPFTLANVFGTANSNSTSTLSLFTAGIAASTTIRFGNAGVTGQFLWDGTNGRLGIASTTPFAGLSLGSGNGSSTQAILVAEHRPATSTAMTIDWRNGNTQTIRKGTAGITLTFSNYTDGATLKLIGCNPTGGTAGTFTWPAVILWPGATAPAQTTTANKCDVYSFVATQATSTLVIFGASSLNF